MEDTNDMNDVKITSYDRLMRAWENSMELARDFEVYSKRVDDEELKEVFKKFAEEEGLHASKFRELLLKRQKEKMQ
ncbi:MAG: rubrerythrin [Clostridiaceae bacterium]|nr:rubrerythrin [Clostridiaceae bacterium]